MKDNLKRFRKLLSITLIPLSLVLMSLMINKYDHNKKVTMEELIMASDSSELDYIMQTWFISFMKYQDQGMKYYEADAKARDYVIKSLKRNRPVSPSK